MCSEDVLKYFDLTTTNIPFFDECLHDPEGCRKYRNVCFDIVLMPWYDFMTIAAETAGLTFKKMVGAVDIVLASRYAKMMKNGVKFPLPVLRVDTSYHEGRHRIIAARLNGYECSPVMLVYECDKKPYAILESVIKINREKLVQSPQP